MQSNKRFCDEWVRVAVEELTLDRVVTYGVVQPGPPVANGVPMLRVNNFRGHGLDTADVMQIASEVEEKYQRTRVRASDVLITVVGSVGQVAVVPERLAGWNVARAVALLRPRDCELARWIALCLRSPDAQRSLGTTANTTVQTTINLKDLRRLQLPIPATAERVAIEEILFALDDRIDLLRQTNTTLESIAQALFKSWFIDFDPVRAKAEGREPEGMNAATAALFPADFEESAQGSIPKGWQLGRFGDVCSNPRAQAKPGQIHPDTPYFGLEHMPRKSIALEDCGTAEGLESGKFWFDRNDVLFGKLRPYFHKVGLAPFRGVCSTDILVMRPLEANWLGFVAMHASSDALISYTTKLSNGARMPRTSWHDIAGFTIVLPIAAIAAEFDAVIHPLFKRIYANIETAKLLRQTRDTLLPRLISGKLRLPEAQEQIFGALA